MEANERILIKHFKRLTKAQLRTLLWHRAHGTRVLCGSSANDWIDGFGGG